VNQDGVILLSREEWYSVFGGKPILVKPPTLKIVEKSLSKNFWDTIQDYFDKFTIWWNEE